MRKFQVVLILLLVVLNSQTASEIYTNKLKPSHLIVNGVEYISFDLENSKVLKARLDIFEDVFFPVTDCLWSNQVIYMNDLAYENSQLYVEKLYYKKKQKRAFRIGAGAGIVGGFVLGLIIFK